MVDFGKITRESFKIAGKVAENTWDQSKKFAKNSKEKVDETVEKKQFVESIEAEARKFEVEAESKTELRKNDIKKILEKIERKYKLLENFTDRLGRLTRYYNREIDPISYVHSVKYQEDIKPHIKEIHTEDTGKYYKVGLGAGFGSAAGAFAAVGAYGTTAGGYAISSLKGGSFIAASLAKLGGGSVATGGFGMVGGAAVLGVLFIVPAIVTAATWWRNGIMTKYNNAEQMQKNIIQGKRELKENLEELEVIYISFLKYDTLLDALIKLLKNCSIVLELERDIDKKIKIDELIIKAQKVIKNVDDIRIIDENFRYIPESMKYINNTQEELEDTIQQVGYFLAFNQVYTNINKKFNNYVVRKVADQEIENLRAKAFKEAREEICICSPWVSNWIVDTNNEVFRLIKSALARGVDLRLIYGIGMNEKDNHRYQSSYENVQMLKELLDGLPGRLIVKERNSHFKVLICDEKFYVLSSYNYFSFKGYSEFNKDNREEGGEYSENLEMLRAHKRDFAF